MMRLYFLTFFICTIAAAASGQHFKRMIPHTKFGHHIRFDLEGTSFDKLRNEGDMGCYVPDDQVEKVFGLQSSAFSGGLKSTLMLGVQLNPALTDFNLPAINSFSKSFPAYKISDGTKATLIALGITKANVSRYRYRVVVNDSIEVVHWSPVKLARLFGATQPYGFIGDFNFPDKQVLVEVVDMNNYQNRDGVVFDWRKNIQPYIIHFLVSAPPASNGDSTQSKTKSLQYDNDHDPATGMVSNLRFVQGAVGRLSVFVKKHSGIPYAVRLVKKENGKDVKIAMSNEERTSDMFNFELDSLKPGNYAVRFSPVDSWNKNIGEQVSLDINISSAPITEQKVSLKQILPYLIGTLVILGLAFLSYRRYTNTRLARAAQAKQNISLKLSSIRAQLNPHFMFNALTSIQNLMNKNDTESANHYLSRFASLTRTVLNTSTQELITLDEEIKILDDYLQMEQLRFAFHYQLNVDHHINRTNIDIPAMLLQPFVENAVKHGVAGIREKGRILVDISQRNHDLVFTVSDNGAGFDQNNIPVNTSLGLKLSRERIALLNQSYPGQPAILTISADSNGTRITILLSNWIS